MTEKIHISADNLATFVCPKCSRSRTEDVSKYLSLPREIRATIRCKCGHEFMIVLDRRKAFRKRAELFGIYYNPKTKESRDVVILDLSRSGLRFQVKGKVNVVLGDRLVVEFHLDDAARSLVKKKVIVKNISDSMIGVQFDHMDPTDSGDKAVLFYLFG
ncbi:MAG: PilZ domain-containing protein [Pseudomonadota bacterium]